MHTSSMIQLQALIVSIASLTNQCAAANTHFQADSSNCVAHVPVDNRQTEEPLLMHLTAFKRMAASCDDLM